MADTSQTEVPPQTNGLSDGVDDEERLKMRPADIDADVKEMERRKRVDMIMNSKLFREELERIIETQLKDGSGTSGLMQQISDMMGVSKNSGHVFKNSNCVVPINDIRGIEAMGYAKGEKILRCKLAAVYRLIDLYGWSQGCNTLITARLNQDEEHFLVNPYGMLFHEITASSLIKVDMQGNVVEQGTTNFSVNITAFSLHAAIHSSRPDIKCIIQVHTPSVVAISALKCGLLPLSEESVVIGDISTHSHMGGVLSTEEIEKIARNLGPNNKVLLLTNQGAVCCGETIEEAFFNARNTVLACESQLKLMPMGIDNLVLITDEQRKKIYEAAHKAPESTPRPDQPSILEGKVERKWRVGGIEFEALMRMLDNAGFRTGYIYRHPLVKGEPPKPRNDVEVPPAVSSLGYLLEEEELYRQGLWKKLEGGRKGHDRTRWLNSPNVYQKVEILETGTPDPKKITKWVADGSPTHSSTPVKIENALQFVPKNTNPKEFKQLQQQIKDYRRADKISAGPQSHILEGVTWEEAKKMQDATVTQTGDQVVLMGAASKGIIQRGFQHNATMYKSPYAKNPFDSVTDEELDEYKRVVERKARGDFDDTTDYSESEGLSSAQINKRISDIRSPTSVTSETEEESRDEPQVLRIETTQAPKPSQPEIVMSDDDVFLDNPQEIIVQQLKVAAVEQSPVSRVSINSSRSMKVVRAYKKPTSIRNYYRTSSFSGFPKGSYLLPNPRHFHIAHYTNINRPMRPHIINLISGGRYSSFNPNIPHHISNNWNNNVRPTVTINIANSRTITLNISMQTLREFIYPFATALNINNLPDCKSTSCQTSYHVDQKASITEITNGNSKHEDKETSTSSDTSCEPISEFELQILKTMHDSILTESSFNDIFTDFGSTQTVVDTTAIKKDDENEHSIEVELHPPSNTTSHMDINLAAGDAAETQYQNEMEELKDQSFIPENENSMEFEGFGYETSNKLTVTSPLEPSTTASNNEKSESIKPCLEKNNVEDLLCIADIVTNRALEISDYTQFKNIIDETLSLFKELPYQTSIATTEICVTENTNETVSEEILRTQDLPNFNSNEIDVNFLVENRYTDSICEEYQEVVSSNKNKDEVDIELLQLKDSENLNVKIAEDHSQENLGQNSVEVHIENVQNNNTQEDSQTEVDSEQKRYVDYSSLSYEIAENVDLERKHLGMEDVLVSEAVDAKTLQSQIIENTAQIQPHSSSFVASEDNINIISNENAKELLDIHLPQERIVECINLEVSSLEIKNMNQEDSKDNQEDTKVTEEDSNDNQADSEHTTRESSSDNHSDNIQKEFPEMQYTGVEFPQNEFERNTRIEPLLLEPEEQNNLLELPQQEIAENATQYVEQHTDIYLLLHEDSEYIDRKSSDYNVDDNADNDNVISKEIPITEFEEDSKIKETRCESQEDIKIIYPDTFEEQTTTDIKFTPLQNAIHLKCMQLETVEFVSAATEDSDIKDHYDVHASPVEVIESTDVFQDAPEDYQAPIVINKMPVNHEDEAGYELKINVDVASLHLSNESDDRKRDIVPLECQEARDDSDERGPNSYATEIDITNILFPLGVVNIDHSNYEGRNDIVVEPSDCEVIQGIKKDAFKPNVDTNMHFYEPDVIESCAVVNANFESHPDFGGEASDVQNIQFEQIRSSTETRVEDTSPNEASQNTDTSDTQNYLTADEHSHEQLNNKSEGIIDNISSDIEEDYAVIEYDYNTNSENLSGFLEQLNQHEDTSPVSNEENKENTDDTTSVTSETKNVDDDFANDLKNLWALDTENTNEKNDIFCKVDVTTLQFDNEKDHDKQKNSAPQNSRNLHLDSFDEGISDCKSTCSESFTFSSSIEYDPKVVELSEIVFEYILKQCYEVKDLVLFPEVLYDENVVKMFAKLKDLYLNYYSDVSDEFKNELRINMTDYILKKLECISPARHNESESSSNLSDKLFTISEFISDIFDKFFDEYVNGNESSGSWVGFTNLLIEKKVCHSTPEGKNSVEQDEVGKISDKEKKTFKPIASSSAKDNTEDLTAFQKKKLQSGSELYWISINKSPKNVMETTPRKAVVINVDDIPLKPPADLVPSRENGCKRPLSPILEEAKCNLFNEFQANNPRPKVLSTHIENFEYKGTTDFLAGGDYVQFDKPENDVVLINEAKFFRGSSPHHTYYIQSSSVTFHPNGNHLKQSNNNKVESTYYSKKIEGYTDNDEGNWMGYESAKF